MIVMLAAPVMAGAAETEPLMLWYRTHARIWNEALPIGNGRLGAMVYGDPAAEHLQLNENSVWSGERHFNPAPQVKENLPTIRKLLFDGKYEEAQALAEKTMTTPKDPRYGHYQPLGHKLLRATRRRREGTRKLQSAAGQEHPAQPLRQSPTLPDRRQFRRRGGAGRDAAAVARRRDRVAARAAAGVGGRLHQGAEGARRIRDRSQLA